MSKQLEGRRIVLTGASRGVGFATARLFLAEGAELIGVARDPDRLARAARELDASADRFQSLVVDLGEDGFEHRIVDAVRQRWGALDILWNNAAVMLDNQARGLLDEPAGTLERTMHLNVTSPFRLTVALLPWLERGREPRVVHVGSGAGTFAAMRDEIIASYRLSKWAINGMTMLMATQLRGKVAVNAFDPGWVKTDLGGPEAPGTPEESARGALALATASFDETGKFWKDGQVIPY
jgi:NAD(P)-dependent dehydrogenase (short-subunit alcohol dehydrogenase family)